MEDFFIDVSDNILTNMRLLIEGAVSLYETDAAPLHRLAKSNDMMVASRGFNSIGSALYDLREYIREFEEAHIKEVKRETEL